MSDLRSSGEIEQDADCIIMVYRDEYYNPESEDKGLAELIVSKNRMGQIGFVKCEFHGQYSKFQDMEVDIQKTPFTVAGIGDMSGDVFGNGMLLRLGLAAMSLLWT